MTSASSIPDPPEGHEWEDSTVRIEVGGSLLEEEAMYYDDPVKKCRKCGFIITLVSGKISYSDHYGKVNILSWISYDPMFGPIVECDKYAMNSALE